MSKYSVTITWERDGARFTDQKYNRAHRWTFDGGVTVPASSSPSVVPLPFSDPHAVDPEEAFVASLSSCHMLWFLSIAAGRGFTVNAYEDAAEGTMAKNAAGKMAMTEVVLRPKVTYAEPGPTADQDAAMHHRAHEECFIAQSVLTDVRSEPTFHIE
ncbi:MAG: OsmC family protein [Gemmatimonadaceae bacterium]|nr:OsmC family protein [Gemmatimonadaceae bacterium]